MNWAFATLGLLLGCVGLGLYHLLPWPMALKLLRPVRMSDSKAVYVLKRLSPGDLGINFSKVAFTVIDRRTGGGIAIAGWWMPSKEQGGKTAILLHGYADAKVGAIAWAPLWRSLGYHVLAIDLRGHGDSGGRDVTAGFWERWDVGQVIDQLRAERGEDCGEVVVFGVSLGAAVAAAVGAVREDLAAIVLESPFADYPMAVLAHAELMGMPGPRLVRRAIGVAERISGAEFAEVAPVRTIRVARCPVMVISAGEDPLVGGSVERLGEAVASRGADGSEHWVVAGAYHVECVMGDRDKYERRVGEFLKHSKREAQGNT